MDGLKCTVPSSCHETVAEIKNKQGNSEKKNIPCEGCLRKNIHKHNGIYCCIKNWKIHPNTDSIVQFSTLLK